MHKGISTERRMARAENFCRQWDWTQCAPGDLLQMTDNLRHGIAELAVQRGWGAITHCHVEWPLLDNAGTHQIHGHLDMLALCEQGAMIIDHKCLQDDDVTRTIAKAAKEYAGQMAVYKSALHRAGIEQVLTCLHLPLQNTLLVVDIA